MPAIFCFALISKPSQMISSFSETQKKTEYPFEYSAPLICLYYHRFPFLTSATFPQDFSTRIMPESDFSTQFAPASDLFIRFIPPSDFSIEFTLQAFFPNCSYSVIQTTACLFQSLISYFYNMYLPVSKKCAIIIML